MIEKGYEEDSFDTLESSSVTLFKNDMNDYHILSNEEQMNLFKEFEKTHNPQIRELLINSNLPLVLSRAKIALAKINKPNVLLEDLIQEGAKGLIMAFDTFDYHRGVAFSTYATTLINNTISSMEFNDDRVVRISAYRHHQYWSLQIKESELTMKLGRYPTVKELASYINLPEDSVIALKNDFQEILSLNEKVKEEDSSELGDIISNGENPYLKIEDDNVNQELAQTLFKVLNDREIMVLILRYGLVGEEPLIFEDIAKVLNCRRQRVDAIEKNALIKLREYYQTKSLRHYTKTTIRKNIYDISDTELIEIINKLNSYDRNLLYRRYNENLTKIISNSITLEEFRYMFRVIVPKINNIIENKNIKTLKRIK